VGGMNFFNLPNASGCMGPGVYSISHVIEYQKQKNKVSWE
jgi:hypothetical protein